MMRILQIPVDGGGQLLVEGTTSNGSGALGMAAGHGGDAIGRARQSLESSLDQLTPALEAVGEKLLALKPGGVTVEFGLTFAAEAGLIVAKGSTEVHFTVTLTWDGAAEPGGE